MTRDEQLQQKVTDLWINGADLSYAKAFKDGAVWADTNPNWHLCKDEMPEPNVKVLCYTSKGTYFVAWMEEQLIGHNQPTGEYRWSRWNTPIIAWTELPEPPKFD